MRGCRATLELDVRLSVITIGIDPRIDLGGVVLTWHGLMVAVGLLVGAWLAARVAGEQGLDPAPMTTLVVIVAIAGMAGARAFYLLINDPGALLRPGDWLGTRGFAFYGALIAAPIAAAVFLRRRRLSAGYLDAMAIGFALGTSIGRIGDLISGEHYGPPSSSPWAVRYTNPAAEVPHPGTAYQSGGLYEIVLGLLILGGVWPLRRRLRRPTVTLWLVMGLYGLGRFVMFFGRSDSPLVALGLNEAQFVSLALVGIAVAGGVAGSRRGAGHGSSPPSSPRRSLRLRRGRRAPTPRP